MQKIVRVSSTRDGYDIPEGWYFQQVLYVEPAPPFIGVPMLTILLTDNPEHVIVSAPEPVSATINTEPTVYCHDCGNVVPLSEFDNHNNCNGEHFVPNKGDVRFDWGSRLTLAWDGEDWRPVGS